VELQSDELTMGLACPFHLVKPLIEEVVGTLDEMILIPAQSQWVQTQRHEEQMVVRVATPQCKKWYSFPAEEVRALPFDNASSENLAVFVFNALKDAFSQANLPLTVHRVCVTESSGQEVWYAPTP
jgi:6-pyruvoyl-tetrahydropterin synthase